MIITSKNDIIWNYAANILNIAVSIVVLPLILKMLSPSEVGLWYVFVSISSLVLLIDFGFSTTIMRHISYAVSGASEILSEGIPEKTSNETNYALVKAIVNAAKGIYRILSLVSLVLLMTLGSFYIIKVLKIDDSNLVIAWGIYASASAINILSVFWIPILKGSGAIKAANKVVIFSKLSFLMFAALGLAIGGGLVLLTSAYMVSILIIWIWAQFEFNQHLGPSYKTSIPTDSYKLKEVLRRIWPNSKRSGLVNIGAWLTNKGSTLISSYYLGLEITGQFGISLQLFTVVGNISSLLFNSYLPELTSTRTTRNNDRFRQLFSRSILIQWSMTILGNIGVVFIIPILLKLLNMSTELLPLGWLLTLSIIMFLEQNHSTFAVLITLSNHVPFVPSSLISGFSIITISTILASMGFGIGAIILTQGIIQLSFNNWYWPYLVFKENHFKFKELINYAR